MQSTEEVKHGGRCNGHHPGSRIRDQKEVGLRANGTRVGTGMVGGQTLGFFFLPFADINLMTVGVVSHRPTGTLLAPTEHETVDDLHLQRPGGRGGVTPLF